MENKNRVTPLEQIVKIAAQIEKGTLFYVFCPEHLEVYYQAKVDNFITRGVANSQIRDHNGFFLDHHAKVISAPPTG